MCPCGTKRPVRLVTVMLWNRAGSLVGVLLRVHPRSSAQACVSFLARCCPAPGSSVSLASPRAFPPASSCVLPEWHWPGFGVSPGRLSQLSTGPCGAPQGAALLDALLKLMLGEPAALSAQGSAPRAAIPLGWLLHPSNSREPEVTKP